MLVKINLKVKKNPYQKLEIEIQKTQSQEKEKFKSTRECLKAKKEELGVLKPTAEMIKQCIQ